MMDSKNHKRTAGFTNAKKDKLRKDSESKDNTVNIKTHKKAAEHFNFAAKWHQSAAEYHEAGDHDKANEAALIAMGHATIANDHQLVDIRQHATEK